ncbi:MAG: GNAT family N-acetyltransferase [Zavarzinia sp.]|nr:GNAT family N-acetyltransferase [Zavarzinia sp.]
MDKDITLRSATPADYQAMATLFRESVHRGAARDYDAEQRAAWAPVEMDMAAFAARQDLCRVWIAERAGAMAGFVTSRDDGLVDMLFVHPDHLRRGVGRRLLEIIETEARRAGRAGLYANVSLTARSLFEACGFQVMADQVVELRGRRFRNFHMVRRLDRGAGTVVDTER